MPRPWTDAYPPGVPPKYAHPAVALPRLVDDAARDFPDRVAVRAGRHRATYAELVDEVDRLAAALGGLGVHHGATVAIALPDLPARVAALFAVWRRGGTVVLLAAGTEPRTFADRVRDAGVEVAFALDEDLAEVTALRQLTPTLAHVIVCSERDARGGWRDRLGDLVTRRPRRRSGATHAAAPGHGDARVVRYPELLVGVDPQTSRDAALPSDRALLVVTPTGRTVALTHANLVAATFQARLWVPDVQAGRETLLAALAPDAVTSLTLGVLQAALSGATLVLPPRSGSDADATATALSASIARHEPTLLVVTTAGLARLVAPGTGETDLTSLRACLVVGAPLPPPLAEDAERRTDGARVREVYGVTDACGATHATPVYGRVVPGTVGLPLTDTVAIVVDRTDPTRVCDPGEVGELHVAGPQVADAVPGRVGPWLATGDLARVDDDGVFTVVGRAPDAVPADG